MSAKYKSPSFLLPNELNTSANPANDTGINSLYSMDFDGTEYITAGLLSEYISLSAPTSFTVSAWIKTTDTGTSRGIVSSANYSNGLNFDIYDGEVSFGVGSGTATATTTTANVNDGNWHHVVGTYDSEGDASGNTLYIYVDGIQKASNTGIRNPSIAFNNHPLFIGAKGAGSSTYFPFIGKIDEVAIFNRALDSTEISSLWNNGSPSNLIASNLNPIAYYPLGEQAQNSGYPSATGNEWQFPNGVLQDYVMDFDSTSPGDYVSLGDLTNVESNEFTISMWVNKDNIATNSVLFNSGTTAGPTNSVVFQHTGSTFYIGVGGAAQQTLPAYLSSGVWYNFILTVNGTTAKLYIDGDQFGSNITVGSARTGIGSEAILGKYKFGTYASLDGKMSNVAIWNSDQSANIADIYNNGSPQTSYTVSPQNWWKLNATSVYTPSAPNYTKALDFVASESDYISFPDISLTGEFTVSFWMKIDSYAVVPIGDDLSQDWLRIHTSTQTDLDLANSKSSWNSGATFTTGEWQHVVLRRDSSNVCTIFRNSIHYTNNSPTKPGTFGPLNKIGQKQNSGYWNGQLSNLAIFNSALTPSQVSTLFNFGTPETNISFSPQAWWKLDDQTAITDYSGNGNTGTNNGATDASGGVAVTPSWKIPSALPITTPNYTTALDFVSSSTTRVETTFNALTSVGANNDFTVSAWVKPDNATSPNKQRIFGSYGPSNGSRFWLGIRGGAIRMAYGSVNGHAFSGSDLLLSGSWSHIAVTYNNSTGLMTAYINGEQQGTSTHTGTTTPSNANAWIGNIANDPNVPFNGELSNIAVYNTELSSSNIATLYNSGTPQNTIFGSPVGWWKLDNLTTGIQDSSGNGNNGTDNGASPVISDVVTPQPVNGVSTTLPSTALQQSDLQFDSPYSNYSLSFDGLSNLNLGNVQNNNSLTFSTWINTTSTNASIWQTIATNQSAGAGYRFQYLFSNGNSVILHDLQHGGGSSSAGQTVVSGFNDGNWHHFAFTYDGTSNINAIRMYVDTVEVYTNNSTLSGSGIAASTSNLYLSGGATSAFLVAKFDECSIFNYSLTSAQVLEIYNNGRPKDLTTFSGTAPTNWWRLGENAYFDNNSLVVPNSISGANNGTGYGTTTSMISADAPGTYANGIGENLDILDRVGDAALSTSNSQSYNMIPSDISPYVPQYVGDQIANNFSMTFGGVDDYINVGSPSILNFERTDAFSISAWVKRVGSGSYQSIVYKADNNSPYNGYTFYIDNNNKVGFNITIDYSANNYFGKVCTSVLNTDWNNVLITYNGNSNVSGLNIYINGSLQNVTTVGTSSDLTGTLSNSIPLNIGARNNTDVFFNGQIDEVAIFDKALNAGQIYNDIYQPTKTGTNQTADLEKNPNLPNPVAWYRMGD